MPTSNRRGRIQVLVALGLIVGTSLVTIAVYLLNRGTDRLLAQSLRLLLTIVLASALYRGRPWARRIVVALLVVAAAICALQASTRIPLHVMGAVYLVSAGLLVMPSASAFLAGQRAKSSRRLAGEDPRATAG
jgi:hypothetical protein